MARQWVNFSGTNYTQGRPTSAALTSRSWLVIFIERSGKRRPKESSSSLLSLHVVLTSGHERSNHHHEEPLDASHFLSFFQPRAQRNRQKAHQLNEVEERDHDRELKMKTD